ncbi:MAG: potassium channel protein [Gammaproteobacteria bacterium]|nr:potassium channel protein [Gammaproteobacteria bacterium]
MNMVTSIILRRMRTPFLLLIGVYSLAILGMVLIPGVDDQGNVWHMSFFHAFYFVSFTATTIGFGEIPYPLTEAQRLWALVTVYSTVIAWFYALGKILALIQDKAFKQAVDTHKFKNDIKALHQPFYLICGFGETGKAVVNSFTEEHYRVVVVEKNQNNLNALNLDELKEYVPSLIGDASEPDILELAGIRHPMCQGVIAVTASDETNLKIAIGSKLLHPEINVACRSEFKDIEENMLSFGTNHVVNPYETFAEIFSMLTYSPSLHLIYDWLTGAPNTTLSDPIYIKKGPWILCGYGRFGRELYKHLKSQNISTVVIDPDKSLQEEFDLNEDENRFIIGNGTDHKTLKQAGIESATGLIAGSDNDSNNLSIIMTALDINESVFSIARQNKWNNRILYSSLEEQHKSADTPINFLTMHPREIIARKIRTYFLTPLLNKFLTIARQQTNEWSNITISRLSAVVGESRPHVWSATITNPTAPAVSQALSHGRSIKISHLTQDPGDRKAKLRCVPLLLLRDEEEILLPEDELEIKIGDELLFCGTHQDKDNMHWTLNVARSLNYVMSFKDEPESYIWRLYYHYRDKKEHRKNPR